MRLPVPLIVGVVLTAGCFDARVDPELAARCASVGDCPTGTRCELSLGRCLPEDETVPRAIPVVVATAEDTPVTVSLVGEDDDGDALTYLVEPPGADEGAIGAVVDGVVTFTPAADFTGTATFVFRVVDDAGLTSTAATVSVDVTPVDDAPRIVAPAVLSTLEDQLTLINVDLFNSEADDRDPETIQVIDIDSSGLVVEVGASAIGASLSQQTDGDITWLPPPDFFGVETLDITAIVDGQQVVHRLTIEVQPVNDPPAIAPAAIATQEDDPVEIDLTVTDVDDLADDLVVALDTAVPTDVGTVTIEQTPPRLRFTPATDFVGETSLRLRVTDPDGAVGSATFPIKVISVIDAPVAGSATFQVAEDGQVEVDLVPLSGDPADLDHGVQALPEHGTLDTIDLSRGLLRYRPAADFFGVDRVLYSVNAAGSATSVVGTLTFEVLPQPDAPRFTDTRLFTDEDVPVESELPAVDPDGDALTAQVLTPPSAGDFELTGGLGYVYVPFDDAFGADTIELEVDDGTGRTASAVLTVDVRPTADPPVALDVSANVLEDGFVEFSLTASSVDPVPLTWAIVQPPARGTATLLDAATGRVRYTPAANVDGVDSFTWLVSSSSGVSAAARASITIEGANDPPVLQIDQTVTTLEDQPLRLPFSAADVDGDTPRVEIAEQPGVGTASVVGGEVVFSPGANDNGVRSFLVRAVDADGATATARVTVTILAVPDAPVARAQTISVAEDGSVIFTLQGETVDGLDLDFLLEEQPQGTIEGFDTAQGTGLYRPRPDFVGSDRFAFRVRDTVGTTSSAPAQVTVTVTPVPDAPRLTIPGPVLVVEDGQVDVVVGVSDVDGDNVTLQVAQPAHGTTTLRPTSTVRYIPAANFNGVDSFLVTATDATGLSTSQLVEVTVAPVADPPTTSPLAFVGVEDVAVSIQLRADTVDGDDLDFAIVSAPTNGVLRDFNPETGVAVFDPARDFAGATSFTFAAVNTAGQFSAPEVATITLAGVNDPPSVALGSATVTLEDQPLDIVLDVDEPDEGDAATIVVVVPPERGEVVVDQVTQILTYIPDANENGADAFTVIAEDTAGLPSAALTIGVTIVPVADPPGPKDENISVLEDEQVTFALTGSTVDGGQLTFVITRPPLRGTITAFNADTGIGTYKPGSNVDEDDDFGFVARDERGVTGTEGTVSIDIVPVNDPPQVVIAPIVTTEDTPIDVIVTIADVEGDPTTLSIVDLPARGSVQILPSGNIRYTPTANLNGSDGFSLRARDTVDGPLKAVTVTVLAVPDPPVATPSLSFIGDEDGPILIQLAGSSADGEAVRFQLVGGPANGTLVTQNLVTGALVYVGNANYNGPDSLVFAAVTDTQVGTSAAVGITVRPVNDPPTLVAPGGGPVVVARGQGALTDRFTIEDVDGNGAGLVVEAPAFGIATPEGDHVSYRAIPEAQTFVGLVDVVVRAVDTNGATSAPVTVQFRVVVNNSCATLRNSGVTTSGLTRIGGRDGGKELRARCDMTTAGGGWTMVAKVKDRWRFDDALWTGGEVLNPEDLEADVATDAKLEAWGSSAPPAQLLLETFNIDGITGRQTVVIDLDATQNLDDIFIGAVKFTTDSGLSSWRNAFAPASPPVGSPVCLTEGLHPANVVGTRCRLCATQSRSGDLETCGKPDVVYGIGLDVEPDLVRSAGAVGDVDEARTAIIWTRDNDFTQLFPKAKDCAEHASLGRVLSGFYGTEAGDVFCTF